MTDKQAFIFRVKSPSESSGVGGGASGASADAPTVGHPWQSDTNALSLKKRKKKRLNKKKQMENGKKINKWF